MTDNFCVAGNVLTVAYSATGTGHYPDIHHLNLTLYTDSGRMVDYVIGAKNSGTISLRTRGQGCYYLELDPYDATWTIVVSQPAPVGPTTGNFSLSGDSKMVTDNFCVVANVLTIGYSASGIGQYPEIHHLNVTLYTDAGGLVDYVIGVKGDGTISLRTKGEGCYYLVVEPYDAAWSITVSE